MSLLNAGCGTHYANGWVNVDVWEDENTKPDVIVDPSKPYPFSDNEFDATFLGHVLEHVPWTEVPTFLEDIFRITKKGGPVLIVGPDVFRTLKWWKENREPWSIVEAVLEHQVVNYNPPKGHKFWAGAAHHWNCHEKRVESVLSAMGKKFVSYTDRIPNNGGMTSWKDVELNIDWPVVGMAQWQFATLTWS